MTSTMPVNEREMIIDEIKKLARKQYESLTVPMSNLYSLATTYYANAIDSESQGNCLLFNGLQHFTTGTTREQLRKLIKCSQLHKIKSDHDTLETCIMSEKNNGEPAEDLKFFGQPKETVLVFQSTISPVDDLMDTEITLVEFTLYNPNKSSDKKYRTKPPVKKPDERQPHIHTVKNQVETPTRQRDRRDTESEASTS
jgi:hypothetical protein